MAKFDVVPSVSGVNEWRGRDNDFPIQRLQVTA
jgi:hypothetical protein